MKYLLRLWFGFSALLMAGCATTEALYAEYDALCPIGASVSSTGVMTITGVQVVNGGMPQTRTQEWEPAVYFGFDLSNIQPAEQARLEKNIAVLNAYPAMMISVQAYTDHHGEHAHNRSLSYRRMKAVLAALEEAGIERGRIRASYLGEQAGIHEGNTLNERVINRRVELMPLDAQGRPLMLNVDFDKVEDAEFVPPSPVR